MSGLEQRAARQRSRMLKALGQLGIDDPRVLDAMDQVPRHAFVERFWRVPPSVEPSAPARLVEHQVTEESGNDVLAQVYDPHAAILIRRPDPDEPATASISAPVIVALMLSELKLEPGLRVLEIGTGSGYNAALLAKLVGDPTLVTTVDIDAALTSEAAQRLRAQGGDGIDIRTQDGALGVPERAPFDRIIATVGCADLAPAWAAQLAPGGFMLVPLEHGAMHPRVLVPCDPSRSDRGRPELRGRFVGRSGFVRIQGRQAHWAIWPRHTSPQTDPVVTALPSAVAKVLDSSNHTGRGPGAFRPQWNFATYLAVRDRRAARTVALIEDGSGASIEPGGLATYGPRGATLGDRLVEVATDWIDQGCPDLDRYALRFESISDRPPAPDTATGPWTIDRIDYRQHLILEGTATSAVV